MYGVLYSSTFSLADIGVDKLLIFSANWLEYHPTLGLAALTTAAVHGVHLQQIFS